MTPSFKEGTNMMLNAVKKYSVIQIFTIKLLSLSFGDDLNSGHTNQYDFQSNKIPEHKTNLKTNFCTLLNKEVETRLKTHPSSTSLFF